MSRACSRVPFFKAFPAIALALISCNEEVSLNEYLTETTPRNVPQLYKPELIPEGKLVHSGIFSPDFKEYYFTVSDRQFQRFDVRVVRKENGKWSRSREAFFNTGNNEHGTSFSPDGRYVYFSSTRPIDLPGISDTWHIWRSEKVDGQWSEPEFVDIPNLRDKLVSHPSITLDGTLYFHAGATDYSDLSIYYSLGTNWEFADAVKLPEEVNFGDQQNTPYISPDESYLLYEAAQDLYISRKDKSGRWLAARPLDERINRHGKGNPYITPDQKYLFYVAGLEGNPEEEWAVYWVSAETMLTRGR